MAEAEKTNSFWIRHADKAGASGSVFTALCCMGVSPVLSFLTAAGLGFLINDAILIPLLIVFVAVTLAGLYQGMRRHGRPQPFWLGAAAATATVVFIAIIYVPVLAAAGVAALVAATVLNIRFGMQKTG